MNAVDSGMYILFGLNHVKFLHNVELIKTDVMHIGADNKELNLKFFNGVEVMLLTPKEKRQ